MFYTIYKTTNIINGKFYIGKHQTKNLNDGYIGSGRLLKRAIDKYGIDNFHKEILHICKDEKHMDLLESILVVPDSETNYNLCDGGKGGWSYINRTIGNRKYTSEEIKRANEVRLHKWKNDSEWSDNLRQKWSEGQKKRFKTQTNAFKGKNHTEEAKQKISNAHKGKVPWNKGKPRSEETKEKIRQTLLKRRDELCQR